MPLGESYNNMIGPVGNINAPAGFESYVDPETGVQYQVPVAPVREAQQRVQQQAAETRAQRQRQADAMRILNRIAGPAPDAPREDPLLNVALRNTRDIYRLRSLQNQQRNEDEAFDRYNKSIQGREKILDQILRGQQFERAQTFAESQAETAQRKADLAEKQFAAKLPTEATQRAIKSAEEISQLRDIGAAQAGPLDIAAFAAQNPGQDPLALMKEFRRLESSRMEQGRPVREEAGLPTAPAASLEDIIRNVPGLGEELAGRVTPRLTTAAKERVFGKSKRSKELDALLEALSPQTREQMFPISEGRFGLGETWLTGGPLGSKNAANLINLLNR